jgi:hypothetical protein
MSDAGEAGVVAPFDFVISVEVTQAVGLTQVMWMKISAQ